MAYFLTMLLMTGLITGLAVLGMASGVLHLRK